MEKRFEVGKIYSFYFLGIIDVNGQKFIQLSDGEKDTYRVYPYDFQIELEPYNTPSTVKCMVKSVNVYGLPNLVQYKKAVLESLYQEIGSEYAFTIKTIDVDENSGVKYYQLRDMYGIFHRYYPKQGEPERNLNDVFSLKLDGIKESSDGLNKCHLLLSFTDDNIDNTTTIITPQNTTEAVLQMGFEVGPIGYEDSQNEFKTSIVFVAGEGNMPNIDKQIFYILKTIAGFLNNNGGNLYLGVNDNGFAVGIEHDLQHLNSSTTDYYTYEPTLDHYQLKIRNTVKERLGTYANNLIDFEFIKDNEANKTYCKVSIKNASKPILLDGNKLYQRAGNMTQILKGDDLISFIEHKFVSKNEKIISNKTTVSYYNVETEDILESEKRYEVANNVSTKKSIVENLEINTLQQTKKQKSKEIWYYITFYKNGNWSFQNESITSDVVEYELPILKEYSKERMVMVYENGCVNVVRPYDIIKPKGKNGRKLRNLNHEYNNGWNVNEKLKKVFLAYENDLIAFESEDENNTKYIKIHFIKDISLYDTLHLKGNILVNPKLKAKLISVNILPDEYRFLVSELILKKGYTSSSIGFKYNDINFRKPILNYEKLIQAV